MAKMTLEDLRKLRDQKKKEVEKREVEGKTIQIIVGMGTCGIAAGAKQTFDAIVQALDEQKLGSQVVVRQTGCMGLCYVEPTVEVIMPGMPDTIYGSVDVEVAKEIVKKHVVAKTLVDKHIFDRPAVDIVKK
jgi:NADP-reducing hydrogenase subunit HndB